MAASKKRKAQRLCNRPLQWGGRCNQPVSATGPLTCGRHGPPPTSPRRSTPSLAGWAPRRPSALLRRHNQQFYMVGSCPVDLLKGRCTKHPVNEAFAVALALGARRPEHCALSGTVGREDADRICKLIDMAERWATLAKFDYLATHPASSVRRRMAQCAGLPASVYAKLLQDSTSVVVNTTLRNPATPIEVLRPDFQRRLRLHDEEAGCSSWQCPLHDLSALVVNHEFVQWARRELAQDPDPEHVLLASMFDRASVRLAKLE